MATIKSFTSLEQSKKLAEILPLESADMYYWLAWSGSVSKEKRNTPKVGTPNKDAIKTYWCPCWSLAALLGVLPDCPDLNKHIDDKWFITTYPNGVHTCLMGFDNPIDACYEMIIRLHELNLL